MGAARQGSREVTVTLAEHPDAEGKAYLGVTFVPLSGDEYGPGGTRSGSSILTTTLDDDLRHRFEFHWPNRELVERSSECVCVILFVCDVRQWQSGLGDHEPTFLGPSLLGRVGRRVRWRSYTPWLL